MSDQYDNTNSGAIFKNDKKETDSHPDYKGSLDVDGQQFWVSSWINTSKAGAKYMSLKITKKEAQGAAPQPQVTQVDNGQDNFSDDIPF